MPKAGKKRKRDEPTESLKGRKAHRGVLTDDLKRALALQVALRRYPGTKRVFPLGAMIWDSWALIPLSSSALLRRSSEH
jgi:hypothetical protein